MSYAGVAITELALIGVADPGVPNKERIVLRPMQTTSLAGYCIIAGIYSPTPGIVRPLFDTVFWFQDATVGPPSWILVYTGQGQPREDMLANGERVLTFFWQRLQVVFSSPTLVPVLIRPGAVTIGGVLP